MFGFVSGQPVAAPRPAKSHHDSLTLAESLTGPVGPSQPVSFASPVSNPLPDGLFIEAYLAAHVNRGDTIAPGQFVDSAPIGPQECGNLQGG